MSSLNIELVHIILTAVSTRTVGMPKSTGSADATFARYEGCASSADARTSPPEPSGSSTQSSSTTDDSGNGSTGCGSAKLKSSGVSPMKEVVASPERKFGWRSTLRMNGVFV